MFRLFKSELKRMITSRYLLFGILVCLIGVFMQLAYIYHLYFNGIDTFASSFEKWIPLYNEFGRTTFLWLFPLAVSIPYAWTVRDELNSGYVNQMIVRVKRQKYFFTKLAISFVSGFLVSACALSIDFIGVAMVQRTIHPEPNGGMSIIGPLNIISRTYYEHPYLYLLFWIVIFSVWGGVISGICTTAGLFIKNKFVVLVSAQIIFILQSMLVPFIFTIYTEDYNRWFYFLDPTLYRIGSGNTSIFSVGAVLLAIEIVLVAVKGKLYESV